MLQISTEGQHSITSYSSVTPGDSAQDTATYLLPVQSAELFYMYSDAAFDTLTVLCEHSKSHLRAAPLETETISRDLIPFVVSEDPMRLARKQGHPDWSSVNISYTLMKPCIPGPNSIPI
ncbi:hypothetical protein CHS0354_029688 [Potamilus streckersoni]|uniref:Uncharacterized protein n=1 Tax=Potamilus streckersoni TaxID=2493646 RepID=A0AAE0RTL7_9BIVA|nr:hypothetical protein CHS0354_029688 [Potamilus streckersoni]